MRIAPCAVDFVPNHLTLHHLRREVGISLEINGTRVPSSDKVSITLDGIVWLSGPMEFEVCENGKELILCGSLWRVVATACANGSFLKNDSRTGRSVNCYSAASKANGRSTFFQPKLGVSSPSMEV